MLKNRLLDLKNKLINIDKRNTSLLLRRCLVRGHFDVGRLGALEKSVPESTITNLLQFKPVIPVKPGHRGPTADALRNNLSTLKNEADSIEAENGSYEVYLGWPFLEGTFPNGDYFRCPMLLVPVRLKTNLGKQAIEVEPDEARSIKLNRAFLLAFLKNSGSSIKDDRINEIDSVPNIDGIAMSSPSHVARHVMNLYANAGVVFEKDEPQDGLVEIPNAPPSSDPKRRFPFRVLPHAVIGQFPQAATSILADFDELIQAPPQQGKVAELIEGINHSQEKESVQAERESDRFYVCETDNSQEKIIEASRVGCDVLVQGPPGTGKSQVITNLVADNLARGRKVLIVCEKRAALDVVYRRLHKAGLSHLLQLVHDPAVDRDSVYEKSRQMIEHHASGEAQRYDKEMDARSQQISRSAASLEAYAVALHKKRECGLSLFDLYHLAGSAAKPPLDLTGLAGTFTYSDFESLSEKAQVIVPLKSRYDAATKMSSKRKPFASLSKREADLLVENSANLIRSSNSLSSLVDGSRHVKPGSGALSTLHRQHAALSSFKSRGLFGGLVGWFHGRDSVLQELAKAHGEASDSKVAELKALVENGSSQAFAQSRLKSAHYLHWLFRTVEGCNDSLKLLDELSRHYSPDLIEGWRAQVRALEFPLKGVDRLPHTPRAFEEITQLEKMVSECTPTQRKLLDMALAKAPNAAGSQAMEMIGKSLASHWISIIEKREPMLVEFNGAPYLQARQALAEGIEAKARLAPKHIDSIWATRVSRPVLFDWGACQKGDCTSIAGWLKDRHKNWLDWGVVKAVSESRDSVVLSDGFHEVVFVRTPSKGGLELSYSLVVDGTGKKPKKPEARELVQCDFTNDGETVLVRGKALDYGSILHEVSKKRVRWPLRKLVHEFGARGLFELFPVWLCSPETVSAIMPLRKDIFDCVIFDEASQCPVEKAVPSIYRSRNVVVAGDDKQLPPFDLFRRFYESGDAAQDEAYDEADEIVKSESLLHGASRYLYHPLMWHYRSKHESLIRFSNAAFYQNRLQTMPNSEKGALGFKWVEAGGTWEKRRNQKEAEQVAELVKGILDQPAHPSVGVITFNSEQRDLIESKLEGLARLDLDFAVKYEAEKARREDEELKNIFVKNIENVQGDERDIIIFSVAYAKGDEGGMRHQFGSLSAQGGENRLNVAISRAKEKIIIVASIEPEDLKVDSVANEGPKLLKKYLQYARAVARNERKRADDLIESLSPHQPAVGKQGADSGFEDEVASELERIGYRVDRRVGSSKCTVDLAIIDPKNPGRYSLGIELDGENYKSAPTANERDVYRQRFLKSRGWNMFRVTSRDWWLDKHGVLKEIKAKVAKGA